MPAYTHDVIINSSVICWEKKRNRTRRMSSKTSCWEEVPPFDLPPNRIIRDSNQRCGGRIRQTRCSPTSMRISTSNLQACIGSIKSSSSTWSFVCVKQIKYTPRDNEWSMLGRAMMCSCVRVAHPRTLELLVFPPGWPHWRFVGSFAVKISPSLAWTHDRARTCMRPPYIPNLFHLLLSWGIPMHSHSSFPPSNANMFGFVVEIRRPQLPIPPQGYESLRADPGVPSLGKCLRHRSPSQSPSPECQVRWVCFWG